MTERSDTLRERERVRGSEGKRGRRVRGKRGGVVFSPLLCYRTKLPLAILGLKLQWFIISTGREKEGKGGEGKGRRGVKGERDGGIVN